MIIVRTPDTPEEWKAYFDLRYNILRQPLGQPRGSEKNEGDLTGIHLALYDGQELGAIARLDHGPEPQSGQVRFVAVSTEKRGRGYGQRIMQEAERLSALRGDKKMILHARENAVDFYSKLNYTVVRKSQLLFGLVQHFLMEKTY